MVGDSYKGHSPSTEGSGKVSDAESEGQIVETWSKRPDRSFQAVEQSHERRGRWVTRPPVDLGMKGWSLLWLETSWGGAQVLEAETKQVGRNAREGSWDPAAVLGLCTGIVDRVYLLPASPPG